MRAGALGATVAVIAAIWASVSATRASDLSASSRVPQAVQSAPVLGPEPSTPSPSEAARSPEVTEQPRVPDRARGTFTPARLAASAGTAGELIPYRVEVEDGLGVPPEAFAQAVATTLADRRGWTRDGAYRFETDPDAPLRVVLASPDTTDTLCAPLRTRGEVSCRNGDDVVINARRWALAVPHIPDLELYRRYVINHEIGHALGRGHATCPAPGQPAPVMAQQTLGLDGCTANAWPHPDDRNAS